MQVSTSRTRGPYAKGTERREQIIQTATDVFATDGFEGTALKRVAELVGIKEATLFHYFRGKQELLTAVLRERDNRATSLITDGSTLQALPGVAENNAKQPGLTALYAVASAIANDPAHDSHMFFQERYASLVALLSQDIRESQAQGRLRGDLKAEVLARIVIATFDGLQLQWLYDKNVDMASGLLSVITVLIAPEEPQIST
jgi:AcrR family transcriptional regulator